MCKPISGRDNQGINFWWLKNFAFVPCAVVGVVTIGVRKIKKRAGMCGSPLERGGGVCLLHQAFTQLHGGEHTPPLH